MSSISPFTLAIFAFEGDGDFPLPLKVDKRENCTTFVDTEAATVCFSLIGHIAVQDVFARLRSGDNR